MRFVRLNQELCKTRSRSVEDDFVGFSTSTAGAGAIVNTQTWTDGLKDITLLCCAQAVPHDVTFHSEDPHVNQLRAAKFCEHNWNFYALIMQ